MANYLCSLRGSLGGSTLSEIFVHTLAIQSAASNQAVATGLRDAWLGAWNGTPIALKSYFHSSVVYLEATSAPILDLEPDPGVPAIGAAYHATFTPPGLAGSSTSDPLPSQIALAVSMTAGLKQTGASLKGRFYLPPLVASTLMPPGPLVSSGTVIGVADCIRTMFNNMVAGGLYPCVWAKPSKSMDHGELQLVQQLRVGNKFDTIRRRRNKYPETYETRAINGPT